MAYIRKQKGVKPTPRDPFPSPDQVKVVQFQYHDNGENPGSGSTRYTCVLETYNNATPLDLIKPDWKRAVWLLEPKLNLKWAKDAVANGKLDEGYLYIYEDAMAWCEEKMQEPDMDWVRMGKIEDRAAKVQHPGQVVVMCRKLAGPMETIIMTDDGAYMECERWQHDMDSKKGSGRRKAYGFYDPNRYYAKQRAQVISTQTSRPYDEVLDEVLIALGLK